MPIYEYNCPKCKHEFEVLFRRAGDAPRTCPECGEGKPRKRLSSFAVSSPAVREAERQCNACPAAGESCPAKGACAGL